MSRAARPGGLGTASSFPRGRESGDAGLSKAPGRPRRGGDAEHRSCWAHLAAALWLALFASVALAHKASDGYLTLERHEGAITGRLDLALRDLELAVGLDADGDGAITWGELKSRRGLIEGYALSRLALATESQACTTEPTGQRVDRHTDGAYAVIDFVATCDAEPALTLRYTVLHEVDPQHRGLVRYVDARGAERSFVLSAQAPETAFAARHDVIAQAMAFAREGVRHIWSGYDHLLFLVSLLLPAVLVRRDSAWMPAPSLLGALYDVAKTVTAFTIAHSITLALAVLDVVRLPDRFVEAVIALSVVLAALNNLRPVVGDSRWLVAFGFGLVHGFGFAGALGELGLPADARLISVAAFNVGVELGQLAIVIPFIALAWLVRGQPAYRRVALVGGSTAIAVIASVWFAERAFDLPIVSAAGLTLQ